MYSNVRRGWAEYEPTKSIGGITLGEVIAVAAIIAGAHVIASQDYLLFHTSVEFFSVCIAFSIFIVGASAHAIGSNNFVVITSATYLFVAALDSLHALSYKGMPFLNDYDYYGPQFWIAARYLEAAGLLAAIWAIEAQRRFDALAIFGLLFVITAGLTLSILHFRIFPICFVPGSGLTAFKVYSEYAIIGIYAASLWLLHQKRNAFGTHIYRLVRLSLVLMALMEVCFTFYKSDAMSDFFNQLGHLIKIFSFYLLCKAFVVGSLRDPLLLASRELRDSEERQRANARRLADILDLQRDIASSNLDYSGLLNFILERMTRLVGCDGACLEIRDHDEMVYEAATGLAAGSVGLRLKSAASLSGLCMTANQFLRSDDTEKDPRVDREACRRIGLRSMILLPLRYDDRSFGVLKLMSARAAAFTEGAEQTARLMGEFLGVTIARERAKAALQESEARFRGVYENAGTGIAIGDLNGGILSCNPAFIRMLGYSEDELRRLDFMDLVHAEDRDANLNEIRRLLAQEVPDFEIVNRHVGKGGKVLWVHKHVSLMLDSTGAPQGIVALVTDMTERKRTEEHIRLLLREVNHRSKNMLAVVQAVARQTRASSSEDFLARFGERIRALAAAQDLLIKNEWKGVEVGELVRSQLSHFSDLIDTRIAIEGAPLIITASASQTVGMALHELATNAGKYGALSNGDGGVKVAWRLDRSELPEDTFTISWTESGGPAVDAPKSQGFGSTVVGKLAEMKLGARVDLSFARSGLCWRLECAAGAILQRDA